MTFAVISPEYHPGPEFAALALACDVLVVADTFQYVRQSLQNRARLRTPTGTQWITIPIRSGQHGRPIREIEIDPRADWRRTHLRAFRFNYGATPYFDHWLPGLERIVAGDSGRLADTTVASVGFLLDALGSRADRVLASGIPGSPGRFEDIRCRFEGWTPVLTSCQVGRSPEVDARAFRLDLELPSYRQAFDGFVPGCSAVDLLMMRGPASADLLRARTALVFQGTNDGISPKRTS